MLRLFPWWLFLLAALFSGSLTVSFARDYRADAAALEEAIASPPETMALQDLPTAPEHPPFGEFAIRDFAGYFVGVVDSGRSGRSFLVLESFSTPPVYVAFTEITLLEDVFEQEAALIEQDWENRVVRGLLTGGTLHRAELISFLAEQNPEITPDSTFVMADFFTGDREEALRSHVDGGRIAALVTGAAALLLTLIGVFKLQAWRKRRAAQQAAVPPPFESSPIDSNRPR